jgi:hypothetical protein
MITRFLTRKRLVYLAGFVVLCLSFSINLFGSGPWPSWFSNFQKESEQLIVKTVECQAMGKDLHYSGPIRAASGLPYTTIMDKGCDPAKLEPYASQYGLQTRAIALFAPSNPDALHRYFLGVKVILVSLMAIVLLGIVAAVRREFGLPAAIATFALLCVSDWVVGYARNMYWVGFLLFLPFLISFGYYQLFKANKKMLLFYGLLGLAFFLKFLNGNEHATTLIISAIAPIVYYEIKGGKRWQELWRPAALVLGVGVLAFALSMFYNLAALREYYGSWEKSREIMKSSTEKRADFESMQSYAIVSFQVTVPHMYPVVNNLVDLEVLKSGEGHPIKYAMVSFLNYLLLPAITLPIVLQEPLGTVLQSHLAIGIAAYCLLHFYLLRRTTGKDRARLNALRWLFLIGLAGAFSWLVALPGHAYPHAHLNGIIFFMPFLLVCYVIFGMSIAKCWAAHRPTRKRS